MHRKHIDKLIQRTSCFEYNAWHIIVLKYELKYMELIQEMQYMPYCRLNSYKCNLVIFQETFPHQVFVSHD